MAPLFRRLFPLLASTFAIQSHLARGTGVAARLDLNSTQTQSDRMAAREYQALRDAGWGAVRVFRQMASDGVGAVEAIRSIRELFGLPLTEAKEVMVQADGWEGTLDDYQGKAILPLVEGYFEGVDDKKPRP